MPRYELSKYKILIDIDGNSYSARFSFLLRTGSVVFKIAAIHDLCTLITRPWVDFIPVKMDLSDLEEKINWAKNRDSNIRRIARQGQEIVKKDFSYSMLQCYAIHLLTEYSKLLK